MWNSFINACACGHVVFFISQSISFWFSSVDFLVDRRADESCGDVELASLHVLVDHDGEEQADWVELRDG